MADNINRLLNSASRINIHQIQQNQNNKKTDSNSKNINGGGKSFEDIINEQRLKPGNSPQKPVNADINSVNANAAVKANVLTANDIQFRQYALNIKQYGEQELTFSKHAKQRLSQRNIDIDAGLIEKISGAVKKASEKSIKNALVLSGESAFIVSVDNNVVVTAMNNQEMRESVITNIDGTVIL